MRKILTQFICTIVICCQVLSLMPIVMFAKADLSATYSLKPEETYEYKFTPEISGLYILTVTNLSDYSNNRISLTSDDGNVLTEYWQCYDRDLPAPMYFVLQAGTEYTYVHKENLDIFGKHILKIELDDTPVLTLNNTASVYPYATEEEYVVDFVKFTSSDSGWYTFEVDNLESNEAYLMKLYTYTGVLLDDAYYYLSTNGLNVFLDAKTDYYLQFEDFLYSSSKRQQIVRVSKSEFPNLIENQPLPISFWGMEDGEAESISYKYARFVPAKSGLYTFDAKLAEVYDWDTYNWLSEEQQEKQFGWYGTRFLLFDNKGDEIEPKNIWVDGQYVWGISYNQKEYALVAGEEYYLGASTFLSGLYTFNVNHVGTVKLTAPELNLLTSGDLYGESGFNISWSSVAGAASYTVKVLNSTGNVAFIDSVPYSDSEYTISHLPVGTYSVSVNGVSVSGEEGPLSNLLTVSLLDGVAPCNEHKYTSAGGDICTVCGFEYEYELMSYDKTMYAAIDNVAVRNAPYSKSGSIVDRLNKFEKVEITHYFLNSVGNKWYLTKDGNYIYSERLTTKGPKTYTMKFAPNGSGVTNLPENVEVQENVRQRIPGKIDGAPERSGYTFLGYSTNKNATEAEYVIGQAVQMTKDITLYAVWMELNISPEVTEEDRALMNNVKGCPQHYTYQENGNNIGTTDKRKKEGRGLCTSCAATTLIQRKEVLLTKKSESFTFLEFRTSGEYKWNANGTYKGGTPEHSYTFSCIKPGELGTTNEDKIKTLKKLIDEHPEGIYVYCNYTYRNYEGKIVYSCHAIVLSDYNGDQFYAYDPSDRNLTTFVCDGRKRLEGTYLMRSFVDTGWTGTITDITNNLIHVAYISGVN